MLDMVNGFCIGNILKYAQRYGKKGTREDARKDLLLKVIHYGIIALHNHDKEKINMKLSNDTRDVLKNYSTINANLLVNSGNKLATMSQMKNIVSIATLPDTFETDFAIYDLNEFLSAMSLFDDPELNFGESSVQISQGGQSLKYFYSDPTVVTTPKSDITMNQMQYLL